ncbi:hypothetical protein ACIBW9_41975 [Streptomyces sp. NPDC049541]|uniref:hypothetical protein n=1 Tax=Streptomyces sp. NPDC049541 TaxID=3365594 RepID=UPI0037ACB6B6
MVRWPGRRRIALTREALLVRKKLKDLRSRRWTSVRPRRGRAHDNAAGIALLDKVAADTDMVQKALVDQGFKTTVIDHG